MAKQAEVQELDELDITEQLMQAVDTGHAEFNSFVRNTLWSVVHLACKTGFAVTAEELGLRGLDDAQTLRRQADDIQTVVFLSSSNPDIRRAFEAGWQQGLDLGRSRSRRAYMQFLEKEGAKTRK